MTQFFSALMTVSLLATAPSVRAQNPAVCTMDGKEVDRWGPDRAKYDGVITCIRKGSKGNENTVEKHTYKMGHHIEESIDGPSRKEIRRYFDGEATNWLHGEQLEFYPGTTKLKSRGHYVKAREVGLQEKFYQSGNIQQKDLWVQDRADGGVRQAASIGYRENGGIQFIRCSDSRETTIDPKLCGFDAKSTVNLVDEKGDSKTQFVFEKGVKVGSEVVAENSRRWAPAIQRGTIQAADAARLKREKNGDGEKLTWTFADGKIKRTSFLDGKGFYTDDDSEFFASGKPARKTRFNKSKAIRSDCWWENGKPKAKFERDGDKVTATFTWDNGTIKYAGNFTVPNQNFSADDAVTDLMVACEEHLYQLERQGHFIEKRRDGSLRIVGDYKDGQPVGWLKSYDKAGNLETEESYATGTRERPGMVTARKTYEAGKLVKEEKFNSDGSIQD